jgi:hypothetical protein
MGILDDLLRPLNSHACRCSMHRRTEILTDARTGTSPELNQRAESFGAIRKGKLALVTCLRSCFSWVPRTNLLVLLKLLKLSPKTKL